MSYTQQGGGGGRSRNNKNMLDYVCFVCDEYGTNTCGTSVIFLGFIGFYILSFLWDIFVIRGGYLALGISELPSCVGRTEYFSISPALVLVMLFCACFHAISLVWIIGFVHSKNIGNCNDCWAGRGNMVDVPTEYNSRAICIPMCCFDLLMIIQFGLSLYVYLFLEQLIEYEPETYVDKFCIGYDETEEAFEWMQISLFFFIGTIMMGCLYCCLIRIATNGMFIIYVLYMIYVYAPIYIYRY